jgi:iron(III) transport system permease protein
LGRGLWPAGRGHNRSRFPLRGRELLGLSAAVTGLAIPVGVAIALALRSPGLPGRNFWRAAVLLPLLVPDFVLAYSWLRAYARAGLTSEAFGFAWPQVQGPVGVTVIVASQAVPLVYLITAVGLSTRAEPTTERAARASGARPLTVLTTVTLPLLGPAIATAAVLIFVLTLGTFAVPQVIGSPAGFRTITIGGLESLPTSWSATSRSSTSAMRRWRRLDSASIRTPTP